MIYTFYPKKNTGKPIYTQLYEYIRDAIKTQKIISGTRLPSIREASSQLHLSKTTIESAYFQLATEGYIESLPKKGYYVSELMHYFEHQNEYVQHSPHTSELFSSQEPYFKNENVHEGSLDIKAWKKLYNHILFDRSESVYSPSSHQGELILRKAISQFVNGTRGGNTSPEQVVIGAGIQYLIGILAGMIKSTIRTAAVEDPGYEKARYVFEDYGFDTIDIPVGDDGLQIESLKASHAKIVYVSPSHQFPTGSLMPISKRLQLLSWADSVKGFILEDDYDSLIRFESKPVPCLQGLDQSDRVIYLGSFSKILTPALRISYMILPRRLMADYQSIAHRYTQSSSKLEQIALALFIQEGHIDKHLRKIKRIYHKKMTLLQKYLEKLWGDKVDLISADSGLHAVITLKSEKPPDQLVLFFENHGISVNIIRHVLHTYEISLSYSGIPFDELNNMT